GCGRYGCVETYVSASGIRRTVFELLSKRLGKSELRRVAYDDLTAERIFTLAQQGDAIALEAFAITGKRLGKLIANTVAAYEPEAVILFGGLSNAGKILMEPMLKSYEESVLGIFKGKVKIRISGLNNGRAAVLGASSLFGDDTDEIYTGTGPHEPVSINDSSLISS
ncbi:MAG TPA: ROK family protein, partial [Bacteroidota bacterium]|nr:ROK family protein [Bacteroidota bacterium]